MRKNFSQDSIRVKKNWRSPVRITSELCESEREKSVLAQPDLHMTGIILCLTLRKILNSGFAKLQKFSFFLIRSLYIESKRPKKLPKYPKNPKSPETGKKYSNSSFQPQVHSKVFSFLSQTFQKSFKKIFKCFQKNSKISTLQKKLRLTTPWPNLITHKKFYFALITKHHPDYIKISETFEKFRIFKLISAFQLWNFNVKELKAASFFASLSQVLLPLPVSIHDYIDDFFEVSKDKKVEASYFSYLSTQEFTSRL